jgi:hypothetical protein
VKRTGFLRRKSDPTKSERLQAERAASRQANVDLLLGTTGRPATMGGSTSGEPIDKEPKAKPGKHAPTKAEREWMDWIVAYGCVACRLDGMGYRRPAVHHMLRGGQRIGHMDTLPLCDPGHHQNGEPLGMVSRHPWKARFEAKYGPEQVLLDFLRTLKKQDYERKTP